MEHPKKIFISCGELSGDIHGANLVKNLKDLIPEMKVFGLGGDNLDSLGVELIAHIKDLSVVGITELFSKFKTINRTRRKVKKLLKEKRPDICILIDYPGFNLWLAKVAKKENIKVVYYILPQLWAWGAWRIKYIKRFVDKAIVILPFEKDFYKSYGVETEYVGHPILDTIQNSEFRIQNSKTIALLPGSRDEEVKKMLPVMLIVAKRLNSIVGGTFQSRYKFIIAVAPGVDIDLVNRITQRIYPVPISSGQNSSRFHRDKTQNLLKESCFALISSGTATLEAGILGTPMVIIYKVSFLSYIFAKIVVRIKNIGLVNIISGKEIVPEFIQYNAKPDKIAAKVRDLLESPEEILNNLANVREKLGSKGASERAAKIIAQVIEELITSTKVR